MAEAVQATKACPLCGETVLAIATRCKHCQGDIGEGAAERAAERGKPNELLGVLALITPLVSAVLIWQWVGSMNLLQGPAGTLNAIIIGTVLLTAVLCAIEAQMLGAGKKKGENGPVGIFIAMLVLWVVGYPYWFYARGKYGAKTMVTGAILAMVVFVAVAAFFTWAINEQASAAQEAIDRMRQQLGN